MTWYVAPDPPVGLETDIVPSSSPLHTTFVDVIVANGFVVDKVTDPILEVHPLPSLTLILLLPVRKPVFTFDDCQKPLN